MIRFGNLFILCVSNHWLPLVSDRFPNVLTFGWHATPSWLTTPTDPPHVHSLLTSPKILTYIIARVGQLIFYLPGNHRPTFWWWSPHSAVSNRYNEYNVRVIRERTPPPLLPSSPQLQKIAHCLSPPLPESTIFDTAIPLTLQRALRQRVLYLCPNRTKPQYKSFRWVRPSTRLMPVSHLP